MKKITIGFLTEKGKEAYKEISSVKQSLKERVIVNSTLKEKKLENGKVEIIVKIPWLATQLELDEKIIETMSLKNCERDLDYTLEVE